MLGPLPYGSNGPPLKGPDDDDSNNDDDGYSDISANPGGD